MPEKPETRFTRIFMARLKLLPNSWFQKTQMLSIRGIPDILGLVNGKFIALELKVGSNKADGLQKHILGRIEAAGGYARVVTPENADLVLKELEEM